MYWSIFEAILGIVGILATIGLLFTDAGRKNMAHFLSNIIRGALDIANPLVIELAADLAAIGKGVSDGISINGGLIRAQIEQPLKNFAGAAYQTVVQNLFIHGIVKPADARDMASTAFADAAEFGLSSAAVTTLFESIFPEKLNSLNSIGPMLATLAGFKEVTDATIGPVLAAGVAAPSRYDANNHFRPFMPGLNQALTLWARRKITDTDVVNIAGFQGMSPDWVPNLLRAAFRPISPRALATAIQDTPFPRAQMQEVLEDNGFSPDHVTFMLDVLEYNSTKNVRNSYVSAALSAHKSGVVDDAELDSILAGLGWGPEAINLTKKRALIERRETLAKETEKQVVPLVAAGLVSPTDGLSQLETAGVVDWYAQLQITLATTKATLHAALKAEAEARREQLQTQRNLTRAAIANFQSGAINELTLTTELVAIGLEPSLIDSIIAVQTAIREGKLRLVYGQLLSPADAKLLDERVAAIETQLKGELITVDQARTELANLNIDTPEANALLARWAGGITAAKKHAIGLSPWTGQPPAA